MSQNVFKIDSKIDSGLSPKWIQNVSRNGMRIDPKIDSELIRNGSRIDPGIDPEWIPTWIQNGSRNGFRIDSEIDPEWIPKWIQNGARNGFRIYLKIDTDLNLPEMLPELNHVGINSGSILGSRVHRFWDPFRIYFGVHPGSISGSILYLFGYES